VGTGFDKREALLGDHAQNKKLERDDDSKKSHPALVLQLSFFEVGTLSGGLVSSAPE
jgi:hypothetical protein